MSKRLSLLCFTSVVALTTPAYGQANPAASPREDNEIVVTGSRIEATGYQRPTPVTVTTGEQLQRLQPTSVSDALIQTLPSLSGSRSPATASGSIATEPHGSYLSLRGLGFNRNLVLQDGQRVPPSTFDGLVNVDVIPDLLVQRVDVVTGGVSAVYGSDAVSGVVNFILDRKFTGIRLQGQHGISTYGDNGSYKVGAAIGHSFMGDRAHILASYQHSESDGLFKDDRPLMTQNWGVVPQRCCGGTIPAAGSPDNPLIFRSDIVGNTRSAGGTLIGFLPAFFTSVTNFTGRFTFTPNGAALGFDPGTPTGSATQIGGSGLPSVPPHRNLVSRSKKDHGFFRLSYDFTPDLTAGVEVNVGREIYNYTSGLAFVTPTIYTDNPFLPQLVRTTGVLPAAQPVGANGATTLTNAIGVIFKVTEPPELPTISQREENTNLSLKATLDGKVHVLSDWNWHLYYSYGRAKQKVLEAPEFLQSRAYAAIDSVIAPNGQIVCNITLTNPSSPLAQGCVPWNVFSTAGPNSTTDNAALRTYLLADNRFNVVNQLHNVAFNASGTPFSTWAGPVGIAFGGEFRHYSLDQTSNSGSVGVTGVRGLNPLAPIFPTTNVAASRGSQNVWEVNIEAEVPLVRDAPLFKDLTVTGAARWTKYSVSGGTGTWKVGLAWQPIDDIRFRVARSRDIRAPTLYDLFKGRSGQNASLLDPHTGRTPPGGVALIREGNPALKPEVGKTWTVGVILEPKFLPGFRASIDFYDIKVTDAITPLNVNQILSECEGSNGTSPFCDLVTRPLPFSDRSALNVPSTIRVPDINAASLQTRGLDFDLSYQMRWESLFPKSTGRTLFRALINNVWSYKTQSSPTAPVFSTAGWTDGASNGSGTTVLPHWRGTFSATLSDKAWNLTLTERWIGKLKPGNPYVPTFSNSVYAVPGIKDVFYTDVTFDVTVRSASGTKFNLFLNANNLFNRQPPLWPQGGTNYVPGLFYPTIQSLYDVVGRSFTAGVKVQF